MTVSDVYPIRRMDESIDSLGRRQDPQYPGWKFKIPADLDRIEGQEQNDVQSAFHDVCVHVDDIWIQESTRDVPRGD